MKCILLQGMSFYAKPEIYIYLDYMCIFFCGGGLIYI